MKSYDSFHLKFEYLNSGNRLPTYCNRLHNLKFKFKFLMAILKRSKPLVIDYKPCVIGYMISKTFKSFSKGTLAIGNRLHLLVIDYQRVKLFKKHFKLNPFAIPFVVSTWNFLPKTLGIILIIFLEFLGYLGFLSWIKLEKRVPLASSKHQNIFASTMSSVIYTFRRLQCLHLHLKDFNVFSHLRFQKTTISSLYFKEFNVFSHLHFQKTTMFSFSFQRLQCLRSCTLSKDYNVFIYISKTSMSSVIYTFKRIQCLHLHFKDFNVFSHLRISMISMSSVIYIYKISMSSVFHIFQDFNVFCLLHFIRLQRLLSFIGLNVLVFLLHRTQRPLFLCFLKQKETSNVFCSTRLQCPPFYVL